MEYYDLDYECAVESDGIRFTSANTPRALEGSTVAQAMRHVVLLVEGVGYLRRRKNLCIIVTYNV